MVAVDVARLVQSILDGDLRSISRAASFIEAQTSTGRELSSRLFPNTGNALTIGMTGAPGAGKSSLVNLLIAEYRAAGKQVGVIAVDPSSPYSNGALLGDRVRMLQHHADPGVFIRSMATRGRLGGLAAATLDLALLLDAAGRQVILIETVGVGQDELDISRLAEITIVVLAPGAGDDIQALKAGILEVADIIAINKSDLPEAERLYRDTLEAQDLVSTPESVHALVCKTSSLTNVGLSNLVDQIANCALRKGAQAMSATLWSHRLRQQLRDDLLTSIPATLLHHHAEQVSKKKEDPQSAIMALKAALLASPNNGH